MRLTRRRSCAGLAKSEEPCVVVSVWLGHHCERRRLRGNADATIRQPTRPSLADPGDRIVAEGLTRQPEKLMIAYAAKVSRGPVTTDERFVAGSTAQRDRRR